MTKANRVELTRPRSRSRGVWSVAALSIALTGLSGCWVVDEAMVGASGPKVAVIGDSIIVQSEPQIRAGLDPNRTMFRAVFGHSWTNAVNMCAVPTCDPQRDADFDVVAVEDPDIVVVMLGTNDLKDYTTEQILANVDIGLAKLHPRACVVLTTLSPFGAYGVAADPVLREGFAARAEVIADWEQLVRADRTLVDEEDGVHLTETGIVAFSELILDAVDRCPVRAKKS